MEEWEIEREEILARVGEGNAINDAVGDEEEVEEELVSIRKRALEEPAWPPRKTYAKLTDEQKSTLQELSREVIDTLTGGNPSLFDDDLVLYKEMLKRRKNCYALSDSTTPPPREST